MKFFESFETYKLNEIGDRSMKNINESFEDFRLNEIGDGGSKPFEYKLLKPVLGILEKGIGSGSSWREGNWSRSEYTVQYLVRGSVNYKVKIACNVKKRLERPFQSQAYKGDLQCNVGFDVAGESDEAITNFNEQYRLMATISNIIIEFLETIEDTWFLTELYIIPKADDGKDDARRDNKRGKFYQVYIDKQIKRLTNVRYAVYPKKLWKGARHDEGFIITRMS